MDMAEVMQRAFDLARLQLSNYKRARVSPQPLLAGRRPTHAPKAVQAPKQ